MQNIKVSQGQWLGDVVVKAAGSLEALFDMALANDCSITDDLVAGEDLIPPTPTNKRVMNYYDRNVIIPATANTLGTEVLLLEGIDYWGIEYDFVVS